MKRLQGAFIRETYIRGGGTCERKISAAELYQERER